LFADIPPDPSAKRSEDDGKFSHVYFGKLVRFPLNVMRAWTSLEPQIGEEGETRQLITMFDVKKRVFYGNTSMEAEISLLMANQAQVSDDAFKADIVRGVQDHLAGPSWKTHLRPIRWHRKHVVCASECARSLTLRRDT